MHTQNKAKLACQGQTVTRASLALTSSLQHNGDFISLGEWDCMEHEHIPSRDLCIPHASLVFGSCAAKHDLTRWGQFLILTNCQNGSGRLLFVTKKVVTLFAVLSKGSGVCRLKTASRTLGLSGQVSSMLPSRPDASHPTPWRAYDRYTKVLLCWSWPHHFTTYMDRTV